MIFLALNFLDPCVYRDDGVTLASAGIRFGQERSYDDDDRAPRNGMRGALAGLYCLPASYRPAGLHPPTWASVDAGRRPGSARQIIADRQPDDAMARWHGSRMERPP